MMVGSSVSVELVIQCRNTPYVGVFIEFILGKASLGEAAFYCLYPPQTAQNITPTIYYAVGLMLFPLYELLINLSPKPKRQIIFSLYR